MSADDGRGKYAWAYSLGCLTHLAGIACFLLKLCGLIAWPWWLVLLIFLGPFAALKALGWFVQLAAAVWLAWLHRGD